MAHYQESVDTERSEDEVFAYLSDFANTAEWDPGIDRAGRMTPGEIDVGTAFRVVSKAMGQEIPFTYRVTEYDAPRSICLVGESAAIVSRDRMTFEQLESGTRVIYEANLSLKGVFKLAEPVLRLGFKRVGDRALDGLKRTLSARRAIA